MSFNLGKTIKYQLYLLQLENYELGRYWKLLFSRGWFPTKNQRKDIVWTAKTMLILALAAVLHLGILLQLSKGYVYLALFLFGLFLYPVLFTLTTVILKPVDIVIKSILIFRAKFKIKNLIKLDSGSESGMTQSGLKIIGVAGSYGKTTMKEMLKQVLGERFKVLATPDSVNTPVGIARWILNNFAPSSGPSRPSSPSRGEENIEVAIIEMGEHYRGDVEEICNITKPDISVVTGVNEAHMERMGSLQNITDTIFELVANSKPKSLVVLNNDDKNVVGNYKKYIWPDHRVEFFGKNSTSDPSSTANKLADYGAGKLKVTSYKFDTENLNWKLEIAEIGKVELNLLAEYALGSVAGVVAVAKELGMNAEEIKRGLGKIKPVEHRLQPIKSASGILVIDDSYNGNPAGVKEAIKVLAKFEGRRKLYITPGLVETGKESKEIHLEIGRKLAGVADVVILIKNSVANFIESGILNFEYREGQKQPQIIWFNSAEEAHAGLKNILQPNDVILFQNDWGDSYL